MSMTNNSRHAAILTAIPVEYQAVRKHLTGIRELTHPQGTVYEKGAFFCPNGSSWSVMLAEIGAGNPGAALETERAVTFFSPSILLFIGVAGGLKDVHLCDVVAATKVYGYESGKSKNAFEPRPEVRESSYPMIQRARAESKKPNWLSRLSLSQNIPPPRVHVAPIAAGEKIIASKRSAVFKFLRNQYSDAVAVEMEGRGFLQAAHANPNVSALIVRGISDCIAGKTIADSKGYQELAAQFASAFAFEVLANLEVSAKEIGEYTLVISADFHEFNRVRIEAIVAHLKELTFDPRITLKRTETGSVKLVLEGTPEGFQRLEALFKSGQLSAELGLDVIDIRWLPSLPHRESETELEKQAFLAKDTIFKEKKGMTKAMLVAEIAKEASITSVKAEKALNAVISGIKNALSKKESVTLIGFGNFMVTERSYRKGRNPQTGRETMIPAIKTPKFKPSMALKDAINQRKES